MSLVRETGCSGDQGEGLFTRSEQRQRPPRPCFQTEFRRGDVENLAESTRDGSGSEIVVPRPILQQTSRVAAEVSSKLVLPIVVSVLDRMGLRTQLGAGGNRIPLRDPYDRVGIGP